MLHLWSREEKRYLSTVRKLHGQIHNESLFSPVCVYVCITSQSASSKQAPIIMKPLVHISLLPASTHFPALMVLTSKRRGLEMLYF